jgi:hypothetical protein
VGLRRDRGRPLRALTVLGGAILVVDLRLLGLGLKEERVRSVGQSAQPWLIGGLAAAIISGVTLLASLAADKYCVNGAFWIKMYFLLAAIIFTFTIRRAVVMGDDGRANSRLGEAVAITSHKSTTNRQSKMDESKMFYLVKSEVQLTTTFSGFGDGAGPGCCGTGAAVGRFSRKCWPSSVTSNQNCGGLL